MDTNGTHTFEFDGRGGVIYDDDRNPVGVIARIPFTYIRAVPSLRWYHWYWITRTGDLPGGRQTWTLQGYGKTLRDVQWKAGRHFSSLNSSGATG